eukprot:COSAG06_NODE_13008_length_1303_cov_1.225083_1_plen_51_part_00
MQHPMNHTESGIWRIVLTKVRKLHVSVEVPLDRHTGTDRQAGKEDRQVGS